MEPENKTSGAFVGLVIIIIILVAGGIYMWKSNENRMLLESETITTEDSADLDALEQDLGATSTELDVDVNTID